MPRGARIFTLGHISDLHATPVAPGRLAPLLSKRALGWLSWQVRRAAAHRPEVLEALLADLRDTAPDQLVITGDLTNVSLPEEFSGAREWLERLGPPERVTAVPGNHDAYVRVPMEQSWALWSDYLVSDAEGRALLGDDGPPDTLSFPSVRLRGPVAIVGVCSAVPTPPLFATGRIGPAQLERLHPLLATLGRSGHCRVVLVHHPPAPGATARRRALRDGRALCEVLRSAGAELVLHGHLHRTRIGSLPGPAGPIPVVGVRAASEMGSKPGKRARYHLYDVETGDGDPPRHRLRLRAREWDAASGRFVASGPDEGVALGAAGEA